VRRYGEKASSTLSKDEVVKMMIELEAVGHPTAISK
jgi:hypothetical protein